MKAAHALEASGEKAMWGCRATHRSAGSPWKLEKTKKHSLLSYIIKA